MDNHAGSSAIMQYHDTFAIESQLQKGGDIARWSEHLQLKQEAMGSISLGWFFFLFFFCFFSGLLMYMR